GDAWGVTFLERNYLLDETKAAYVVGLMFIGAAIGAPLFAIASDVLKQRKFPILIGTFLDLFAFLIIVLIKDLHISVLCAMFFLAGISYACKGVGFAIITSIMPKQISGLTIAFVNVAVMSAGIIFH